MAIGGRKLNFWLEGTNFHFKKEKLTNNMALLWHVSLPSDAILELLRE